MAPEASLAWEAVLLLTQAWGPPVARGIVWAMQAAVALTGW